MKPSAANLLAIPVSIWFALCATNTSAQAGSWPSHSHDAQHTGISSVGSQPFTRIRWHVPVDLAPPQGEIFIHYGSPLVTPANTVIVPVKTATGFRVEGHNGATGKKMWTQSTKYQAPDATFLLGLGATLSNNQLLVPDYAGRVIVRQTPDLARGAISRLIFYGKKNYNANPTIYQQNVLINTPLTADAAGNLYFGFVVLGPTPIGLQSGLARIGANGVGTWVSAASVSNDTAVSNVAMSCAPALSNDGNTLYVATFANAGYGYLVALNSSTLAVINRVRLKDPSSGQDALLFDASSAAPTVGPDGDVYFGVLEHPFPSHNDRGWLLHFNSNLSLKKTPGSFGWDDTASIVSASLVPSYTGTSSYLIMTKYNNYAGVGTGDGKNRIAILDPNVTQHDPVIFATLVMKDVLTILGPTPDNNGFPGAVREWCINTAAVDPSTKSVIVNSEDGVLYRWNLTTNTLSESIRLTNGIGEAYTPTVIGADGTVYAINGAILNAVGQ